MRALMFRAAAVLAAATTVLAPAAVANAAATTERIAYTVSNLDANPMYSVLANGTDRRIVTRAVTDTIDIDPDYGPAGQVAFVRVSSALDRYELRVTVPGKAPRLVFATKKRLSAPEWSPDGKKIALAIDDETGARLHIIGADGKGLRRVLPKTTPDGPSTAENEPTWSPDGKRLAYSLRTETYPAATAQLHVVNVTGAADRTLTTGNAIDQQPAFSPDGRRVLFIRQQDNADAHSTWGIYAVDTASAAGGQASPEAIVPAAEPELLGADWSPDARRVAYSKRTWTEDNRGELRVVRADGAGDRLLRREVGTVVAVTWGRA